MGRGDTRRGEAEEEEEEEEEEEDRNGMRPVDGQVHGSAVRGAGLGWAGLRWLRLRAAGPFPFSLFSLAAS